MGNSEQNTSFPDAKQRYAVCESLFQKHAKNEGMNPVTIVAANIDGVVRKEMLQGREYYVVPAVLVQDQVLHNNLGSTYLPAFEITDEWAQKWNMAPVVVHGHPMLQGIPVSARSPEILESNGVGFVFKAYRAENNGVVQLKAEVWLEAARADAIAELKTILERLSSNQRVELSTGFVSQIEEKTGIHNGEQYTLVLRPDGADHLAIFTDKTGACSLDDGCGLGVNNKPEVVVDDLTPCEKKTLMQKVLDMAEKVLGTAKPAETPATAVNADAGTDARQNLRRLKAMDVSTVEIAKEVGMSISSVRAIERGDTVNLTQDVTDKLATLVNKKRKKAGMATKQHVGYAADMSDEDRRCMLADALFEKWGGPGRYVYIEAVYSDASEVVFCVRVENMLEGDDYQLFQVPYTMDSQGVTFGEPQTVTRKVVYEATNNTESIMTEAEKAAAAETARIANEKATEKAAAEKAELATNTAKQADEIVALKAALNKATETITEMAAAVKELKDVAAPAVAEREALRQDLVTKLAGNKACAFDRAELETMPLAQLQKINAMATGTNYAVRGVPAGQASNEEAEPEYMETTPYFADNGKDGKTKDQDSKGKKGDNE